MRHILDIDDIEREYKENKPFYIKLSRAIKKKFVGRICHHRVCCLHVLSRLLGNVKRYVEVGVHNGTSMSYVVKESTPKHCIGIDMFTTNAHYGKDKLQKERSRKNIQKNNASKSKIGLIKGNSRSEKVLAELLKNFNYNTVDMLFIDGDHSYDGVKADFDNYSKFVRPGGWIILDDYMPHKDNWPGICKFVHEDLDFARFEKIGIFLNTELILRKK